MGRGWLVLALVAAVPGTAAASIAPACTCLGHDLVPDGGTIPRNAKAWLLGANDDIELDHVRIHGAWSGGGTRFDVALAPGQRYTVSHFEQTATFTTTSAEDHTPPAAPKIGVVSIGLAPGDAPRHDILSLDVAGTFDTDTALVRIEIPDSYEPVTILTTPRNVRMCDVGWPLTLGERTVTVTAIDLAGNESPPVQIATTPLVATTDGPRPCESHVRCGIGGLAILAAGVVVAIGLVIAIFVIVALRRWRISIDATPISLLVAEHIARAVLRRELLVVMLSSAAAATLLGFEYDLTSMIPILVLGFSLIDALAARRALTRIEASGATAELYGKLLVVTANGRKAKLLASRRAISRASSVPQGTARSKKNRRCPPGEGHRRDPHRGRCGGQSAALARVEHESATVGNRQSRSSHSLSLVRTESSTRSQPALMSCSSSSSLALSLDRIWIASWRVSAFSSL